MINLDNVVEACAELERCSKLGLAGVFIPVTPLPNWPYRHPIYERFWWTAQGLLPLLYKTNAVASFTPLGTTIGC